MTKRFNMAFTLAADVDCQTESAKDIPHDRIISAVRRLLEKVEHDEMFSRHHLEFFDYMEKETCEVFFNNVRAFEEGWGLFDVGCTGYLEIQRLDEEPKFDSDLEAVDFVLERMREGSEYHKQAWDLHIKAMCEGPRPK